MTKRAFPLGRLLFWAVLALPAALMLHGLTRADTLVMDLLHPSGEMAVRLMILAMLPGPLADYFGRTRFLRGWLSVRRHLGVGAFAYALLHLIFYVIDMGALRPILDEFTLPAIWTGWLSLALMLPAAIISNDASMRRLRRTWKRVQRLAYPALLIGLVHWVLLDWHWQPALVHLSPLLIAWSLRARARSRSLKPLTPSNGA